MEQLIDIKAKADVMNKQIDYVELTEAEAWRLISEKLNIYPSFATPSHIQGTTLAGVVLKIVKNKVS